MDDDAPPLQEPIFVRCGSYVTKRYKETGEPRLFEHQIEALQHLEKWFKNVETTKETAVVVMPTGSGKTGVICCLPYTLGAIAAQVQDLDLRKPILIVSPNLVIQNQLEKNLHPVDYADPGEAFLLKRGIVPEQFHPNVLPHVNKVDSPRELRTDIIKSEEIILANAQKWHIRPSSKVLWKELKEDTFSVVIVDEAHHLPAPQWQRIIDKFSKHAKVVFFTATPFRSDGQDITDSIDVKGFAYRLQRKDAIARNIIRNTEFYELKSPTVTNPATADKEVNQSILKKVDAILKEKNMKHPLPGGKKHVALAIARDKAAADELAKMWNEKPEYGAAEAYHSSLKKGPLSATMGKLRKGELQLLVIVEMLLEGFDFPPISVAAIATGIRSPVKFSQFIGRAQRVVRAPPVIEQNGITHIITHAHYKQSENYKAFEEELLIPAVDDEDEELSM